MSNHRSRVAGILGGMGPAATLDFLDRVLKATPARTDQEHIRYLLDNNPLIPDRNAAIASDDPAPGEALASMARGLERAGAEFLVMPCNTAHAFSESIVRAVRIPFVNMIDETCGEICSIAPGARKVGVLATTGTIQARLYQRALDRIHMTPLLLDGPAMRVFMKTVYEIKSGNTGSGPRNAMIQLAETLAEQGADVIFAACTEVPLVLGRQVIDRPLIESTDILARRTIAIARGAEYPLRFRAP